MRNEIRRLAFLILLSPLAVWTGLEPATPCVTGRYSNQLNYHTILLSLWQERHQLFCFCDAKLRRLFESSKYFGKKNSIFVIFVGIDQYVFRYGYEIGRAGTFWSVKKSDSEIFEVRFHSLLSPVFFRFYLSRRNFT